MLGSFVSGLKRQWAGYLALFLVLAGGGTYAAFDPIGGDGDIDACFHKRSGDLDLLKGKRCGKHERRVSWGQAGEQGPPGGQGETGPAGVDATAGPPVAVAVTNSATQPIRGGGSLTAVAFDTERYDTANMHERAQPTRLTAPVTGIYLVEGMIYWESNSVGLRSVGIFKNFNSDQGFETIAANPAGFTRQGTTRVVRLVAGDYVELNAAQTATPSAATQNIMWNPDGSPEFTMTLLEEVP
jgi:hypothetical protein